MSGKVTLPTARRKYLKYCRENGKPLPVQEVDAAECIAHVRALRASGMSCARLADLSGVSQARVSDIYLGKTRTWPRGGTKPMTKIRRSTRDQLLAVPPDGHHERPVRGGARVPAFGTTRRLQALVAGGFNQGWLARELTWNQGHLQLVTQGEFEARGEPWLYAPNRDLVTELYDRLDGVKPSEVGVTSRNEALALGNAAKNGYAGRGCWDPDTIDDPAAVPEWTGACGTYRGYNIHRREDIPTCPACSAAVSAYRRPRKED